MVPRDPSSTRILAERFETGWARRSEKMLEAHGGANRLKMDERLTALKEKRRAAGTFADEQAYSAACVRHGARFVYLDLLTVLSTIGSGL
jgi:hypothetical protein